MLKVIELSPTLGNGGAETLIKDYALGCNKNEIDMRVVTWCGTLDSANEAHLAKAGIPVVHLEELRYGKGVRLSVFKRIIRKICRFIDFRNYIIEQKPDVIHVHLRFGAYLRVLPLRRLNIRLFYTVHNELEQYFAKRPTGKRFIEYIEAKRLIKKYGMTMITLHEDMRHAIMSFFDTDRVLTVHNGINLDRFDSQLYNRQSIRQSLGISEDEYVIGHVGSVHYQKNHEMIVDVFEDYLRIDSSARLLLIGKGNQKEKIKSYIEEKKLDSRVIFLEDRTDVPELMSIMDVFLMPSRWEGYPVVLIEAQSMGIPCVISDRITSEVLLTDKIVMLSIEASLEDWSNAIRLAKLWPDEYKTICMPATGILDDYDIKKSIDRLELMYKGLPEYE